MLDTAALMIWKYKFLLCSPAPTAYALAVLYIEMSNELGNVDT
jgi:hypothetical protein